MNGHRASKGKWERMRHFWQVKHENDQGSFLLWFRISLQTCACYIKKLCREKRRGVAYATGCGRGNWTEMSGRSGTCRPRKEYRRVRRCCIATAHISLRMRCDENAQGAASLHRIVHNRCDGYARHGVLVDLRHKWSTRSPDIRRPIQREQTCSSSLGRRLGTAPEDIALC